MKKLLALSTVTMIVCVVAATFAFAAQDTIQITATVTGVQGISLSGGTWAIGGITTGETSDSSTIVATNTGSVPERFEAFAVTAGDFTLSTTAAEDQIAIWGKCASADPALDVTNALTGTAGQTSVNVDPASGLTVYLKYLAPTAITGGKSDGAATVTVSTVPAL